MRLLITIFFFITVQLVRGGPTSAPEQATNYARTVFSFYTGYKVTATNPNGYDPNTQVYNRLDIGDGQIDNCYTAAGGLTQTPTYPIITSMIGPITTVVESFADLSNSGDCLFTVSTVPATTITFGLIPAANLADYAPGGGMFIAGTCASTSAQFNLPIAACIQKDGATCPAGQQTEPYHGTCYPCPAGTKCGTNTFTFGVENCDDGYYSMAGQSECLSCPLGSITDAGHTTCTPCTALQGSSASQMDCIKTTCVPNASVVGGTCTCDAGYAPSATNSCDSTTVGPSQVPRSRRRRTQLDFSYSTPTHTSPIRICDARVVDVRSSLEHCGACAGQIGHSDCTLIDGPVACVMGSCKEVAEKKWTEEWDQGEDGFEVELMKRTGDGLARIDEVLEGQTAVSRW